MLNLDAFAPESVRSFIQFLYTKDYNAIDISSEGAQPVVNANTDENATTNGGENANKSATTVNDANSTDTSSKAVKHASKGKEVERPRPGTQYSGTILAHTRINAMGDYYNVPELVKLANTRINITLSGASPDAPWVPGLPVLAETTLEIVNNEGLSEVLTAAVAENMAQFSPWELSKTRR